MFRGPRGRRSRPKEPKTRAVADGLMRGRRGPVAMTGGTYGHSTIHGNLATALGGRRRGEQCRFHGSDLKFQVAEGHVRYPNGMVVWHTAMQ